MANKKSSDQMGQRLRRITADLKLYIEKRLELMMLNTGEQISGWMAASVYYFCLVVFAFYLLHWQSIWVIYWETKVWDMYWFRCRSC